MSNSIQNSIETPETIKAANVHKKKMVRHVQSRYMTTSISSKPTLKDKSTVQTTTYSPILDSSNKLQQQKTELSNNLKTISSSIQKPSNIDIKVAAIAKLKTNPAKIISQSNDEFLKHEQLENDILQWRYLTSKAQESFDLVQDNYNSSIKEWVNTLENVKSCVDQLTFNTSNDPLLVSNIPLIETFYNELETLNHEFNDNFMESVLEASLGLEQHMNTVETQNIEDVLESTITECLNVLRKMNLEKNSSSNITTLLNELDEFKSIGSSRDEATTKNSEIITQLAKNEIMYTSIKCTEI